MDFARLLLFYRGSEEQPDHLPSGSLMPLGDLIDLIDQLLLIFEGDAAAG
ncbi:MAG: hypothetical protein OXQ29_19615 [Rhodospirillaceae bacterium]|nr:hypothetical protein [Rhodospirillaceae bacterium]